MPAFLVIFPALVGAAAIFIIGRSVYVFMRLSRLWRDGLEADGTCLRSFVTHSTSGSGKNTHVHSTQNHVFEFQTRDGEKVRFKEQGGRSTTVEGDVLPIRYRVDKPSVATAIPPRDGRAIAGMIMGVLLGLIMLAIVSTLFFIVLLPQLSEST